MPKSNFILIEQSYIIRKGLISLIEKIPNTQVISQIDNIKDIDNIQNYDPDFIIINSNLIDKDVSDYLSKNLENVQVISLSKDHNTSFSEINWIENILLNETQNSILKKINKLIGNRISNMPQRYTPDEISEREADILRNIALGYSNKEIADKLFISTHTVVTHRKNITRKLGIKTVPGLTIYAILNKLIDLGDTK